LKPFAAVLSLAGFSAIFRGLSVDKIMTAATPSAHYTVHITG
jgi:hypothetical protein